MKNFAITAGAFILGAGMTSIYFLKIRTPQFPPDALVQTKVIDTCALSKEILPPPKFAAGLPQMLETNHEAEVRVSWDAVKGAKSYYVFVMTKKGRLVRRYTTSRTTLYLKEIPMPKDTKQIDYKIFLASINANSEDGEKGEGRDLRVNKQASVVAPTIKQIVVED